MRHQRIARGADGAHTHGVHPVRHKAAKANARVCLQGIVLPVEGHEITRRVGCRIPVESRHVATHAVEGQRRRAATNGAAVGESQLGQETLPLRVGGVAVYKIARSVAPRDAVVPKIGRAAETAHRDVQQQVATIVEVGLVEHQHIAPSDRLKRPHQHLRQLGSGNQAVATEATVGRRTHTDGEVHRPLEVRRGAVEAQLGDILPHERRQHRCWINHLRVHRRIHRLHGDIHVLLRAVGHGELASTKGHHRHQQQKAEKYLFHVSHYSFLISTG